MSGLLNEARNAVEQIGSARTLVMMAARADAVERDALLEGAECVLALAEAGLEAALASEVDAPPPADEVDAAETERGVYYPPAGPRLVSATSAE